MTDAASVQLLSFEDYLAWEEAQPERHEFFRGEVFAMVGARRSHVVASGNLFALIRNHLRGGPCTAFMADMKVRVAAADVVFYPDVVVSCDRRDREGDPACLEHPVLVIEVLSEGTAAFDRGDKFAAYRRLEGLREYALIDITQRRIECFRRDPTGHWVLYEYAGDGAVCALVSVGLAVQFNAVFEDIDSD